jgi:RHS repeat-associated protein
MLKLSLVCKACCGWKIILSLSCTLQKTFFKNYEDASPKKGTGSKNYEYRDHLGNVRVVISDAKQIVDSDADNTVSSGDNFVPEVLSAMSYYPFGMKMPGTEFYSGDKPRYDFNGKETDQESGLQDYGMRIYDARIGKFLSVDPIAKEYPWNSTYAFAENDVIRSIDLDGAEKNIVIYFYDQHNEISKIRVQRIEDQNGNTLDNEFWKTNPKIAKTDVLEVHMRANGNIDYVSTNSLSENQTIIRDKYNTQTNNNGPGGSEIGISGQAIGLNEGARFDQGTFKGAEVNLDQKVDAQFGAGTDKFLPGEASKFSPVIKILNDFPSAEAEITGNTATSGVKAGEIYGSSPGALNQPSALNSNTTNNSTVGGVMKARAESAKNYMNKKGGVDKAKIKTKTGTHSSTGTVGRTVDVKVKGVR